MLMLQLSSVAPGYARLLHDHVEAIHCTGDHAKCGCTHERIASHTCCCYQNHLIIVGAPVKHSCCTKTVAQETAVANENDEDRSEPAYRSIPCGSDSRFVVIAAENLKFLQPGLLGIPAIITLTQQHLLLDVSYLSRALSPPDQPPKIALL
jgi:hypothetical protein